MTHIQPKYSLVTSFTVNYRVSGVHLANKIYLKKLIHNFVAEKPFEILL